MNRTKGLKGFCALLLSLVMILLLAACGTGNYKKGNDMSSGKESSMSSASESSEAQEGPKNAEEAAARFEELMAQENAILGENSALWEKVFMAADKETNMIEDGSNYGDFLLKTIDSAKDQFTDDELKLIKGEAEKIREIENELTMLVEKYPEIEKRPSGDDMSIPADDGPINDSMQKFPSFKGKDLDGNDVDSGELFSGNSVTVVNFWFTTCGPCVGELPDLDALNKELAEKGGALIGINAFTLDGGEKEIAEAKDVLEKKGATYKNVYFDSDSEAGKFAAGIYAYPTTYVVDRNGNIVGEPIVGAITGKKQMETLRNLIDEAIEKAGGEVMAEGTAAVARKSPPACCR